MTERVQKLLGDALRLSLDERAELATELLASMDGEPEADVDAAWAIEIERRAERALSSQWVGTDWEIVRDRVKRKLHEA